MFNIKNCITRLFFIFVILRSIKVRDSSVIGVYEAEEDIQEIHVLQFLSLYLQLEHNALFTDWRNLVCFDQF